MRVGRVELPNGCACPGSPPRSLTLGCPILLTCAVAIARPLFSLCRVCVGPSRCPPFPRRFPLFPLPFFLLGCAFPAGVSDRQRQTASRLRGLQERRHPHSHHPPPLSRSGSRMFLLFISSSFSQGGGRFLRFPLHKSLSLHSAMTTAATICGAHRLCGLSGPTWVAHGGPCGQGWPCVERESLEGPRFPPAQRCSRRRQRKHRSSLPSSPPLHTVLLTPRRCLVRTARPCGSSPCLSLQFPHCVVCASRSCRRLALPPPPNFPPPMQELAEELCKVCDGRPVTVRPGSLEVKGNFKPEVMAWLLRLGF